MNEQRILDRLSAILGGLLGDDSIFLRMETRRSDVDGWDSFNYVTFLAIVESEFGLRFSVAEVESFENVGAIVSRIAESCAAV